MTVKIEADQVYEYDWDGNSWGGLVLDRKDPLLKEFLNFMTGEVKNHDDWDDWSDEKWEEFDYGEELYEEYEDDDRMYWTKNGITTDGFSDMMIAKGYDLVILHNVKEEHNNICSDIYRISGRCKIYPQ